MTSPGTPLDETALDETAQPGTPLTARRTAAVVAALVACGLVVAALVSWVPAVRAVALDSFTHRPEAYSELYFADDPVLSAPGPDRTVAAHVTIVWHGETADHDTQLFAVAAPDRGPATSGVFRAAGPAGVATPVDVVLPAPDGDRLLLTVSTADGADSIHFRLPTTRTTP